MKIVAFLSSKTTTKYLVVVKDLISKAELNTLVT